MQSPPAVLQDANDLLRMDGLEATSCETIQNLWAGYGQICRVNAKSTPGKEHLHSWKHSSMIMKRVVAPASIGNKKTKDEGHLRKMFSYLVERDFYNLAWSILPEDIPIAEWLASGGAGEDGAQGIVFLIEDLSKRFPLAGEKRRVLSEKQVRATVDWLGRFHGFWWSRELIKDKGFRGSLRRPPLEEVEIERGVPEPDDFCLWLNGGYTYLATRRKEYATLQDDAEWAESLCNPITRSKKSVAEVVAQYLTPTVSLEPASAIQNYETLIHGDVKSENLFSTADESAIAFFDFQYTGLGLGVCDLAKLFTCSVPLDLLTTSAGGEKFEMGDGERKLLEYYQQVIQERSGKQYPWEVLELHWKTALVDWLRFQASWGFWGNSEWLSARVRQILSDEEWKACLLHAIGEQPV